MYEVRVKLCNQWNRLKSFPTAAEAISWATNNVVPTFRNCKISIYMDGTLIKTLDSTHKA